MSTITKDGKVYQCDKIYYCITTGKVCRISENQISNSLYPKVYWGESDWFCLEGLDLLHADEIGTITPAPIVPENGNWYRVEVEEGNVSSFYFTGDYMCITESGSRCHTLFTGSEKILSKLTVETK